MPHKKAKSQNIAKKHFPKAISEKGMAQSSNESQLPNFSYPAFGEIRRRISLNSSCKRLSFKTTEHIFANPRLC